MEPDLSCGRLDESSADTDHPRYHDPSCVSHLHRCWRGLSFQRSLSSQLKGRRSFRHDDFHYWKGLVREYFREEEKKKREAATAQRTMDKYDILMKRFSWDEFFNFPETLTWLALLLENKCWFSKKARHEKIGEQKTQFFVCGRNVPELRLLSLDKSNGAETDCRRH